MFMLLVRRLVKFERTNRQIWTCVGPFKKHSTAERAMLRVSGVFTTLSATVVSAEQIQAQCAKIRLGYLSYEEAEIYRKMSEALEAVQKLRKSAGESSINENRAV